MEEKPRTIVRVATTYWTDKRGFHSKKSVNRLVKKSKGFDVIDYIREGEADYEINNIINLHDVTDGIYELAMINVSRDFETGCVDEWEYKLIGFQSA